MTGNPLTRSRDQYPQLELEYWETELSPKTAAYVTDSEAVCAFVSSDVGEEVLRVLHERGVKLVLMRCAGFKQCGSGGSHPIRHQGDAGAGLFSRGGGRARHGAGRWL